MIESNYGTCINCKFRYLGFERMPCKKCCRGKYHYGMQDKHVTAYKAQFKH